MPALLAQKNGSPPCPPYHSVPSVEWCPVLSPKTAAAVFLTTVQRQTYKGLFHSMISLKRTYSEDPEFSQLVKLLDEDLWRRYPQSQQHFSQHNLTKSDAKVIVVYDEGKPVACGCFRDAEINASVEIKRMFVVSEMRGRGIAAVVLTELEKWAGELGMSQAILETGINQPEAIALYTKLGYCQIDNYGPYININESLCMSKKLR